MKKRILAMLLSALLVANICACNYVPDDIKKYEPTESEETTDESKTKASEALQNQDQPLDADKKIYWHPIACNGVYHNSEVFYTIDQNDKLILLVNRWGQQFVIPDQDMHFINEELYAASVVVGENCGALVFGDFSSSAKPIKVARFTKGSPKVTIENFTFQTNESYSFKYCNFIDEQTGYLFLFDGSIELSKLLKTTDGGETWKIQEAETVPSFYWKDRISCAKMLDENVGVISTEHYADDNLSRRTYVTIDGGKTWNQVVLPKDGPFVCKYDSSDKTTYVGFGEAYDIKQVNGEYILFLRIKNYENPDICFQYSSTDLKNWKFLK